MKICQPHWDMLRDAIKARGLYALVAESGQQAESNMASELSTGPTIDNFDPLMNAHWAIVNNLADIEPQILFMDGCPICFANRIHAERCVVPDCTSGTTHFDSWIDRAADDQVAAWKSRGSS